MSDIEKPGKCFVCGSTDTYSYDDIECDSYGEYVESYSAVRCKECHFEIRSCNLDENELIAIWNRLSLSPSSPVAPVPPADEVEADGGAGSGGEVAL